MSICIDRLKDPGLMLVEGIAIALSAYICVSVAMLAWDEESVIIVIAPNLTPEYSAN